MNAKSMPRAPLIIIGGNLAVLDIHPDEHGALDRQNAGSDHVSAGCQRKIAGMTTLTVYINSTMPRVGQASRGNASREDVLRHHVCNGCHEREPSEGAARADDPARGRAR